MAVKGLGLAGRVDLPSNNATVDLDLDVLDHSQSYHGSTPGEPEQQVTSGGLYTILPLPILFSAWHTKRGRGGLRILRNRRATVLQYRGQCRWEGAIKE